MFKDLDLKASVFRIECDCGYKETDFKIQERCPTCDNKHLKITEGYVRLTGKHGGVGPTSWSFEGEEEHTIWYLTSEEVDLLKQQHGGIIPLPETDAVFKDGKPMRWIKSRQGWK